jgi:uncharacterized membrane protein YfcA
MSTHVVIAYLAVGLVAGFVSSLLGVGGGIIMVPMLVMLFGLGTRIATVTSLAYIVPISIAGVLLARWHGDVPRWGLVLLATPTGFVGASLGRWTNAHLSDAYVKLVFAVLMVIVSVNLGLQGLHSLRNPQPHAAESATSPAATQGTPAPAPPADQH